MKTLAAVLITILFFGYSEISSAKDNDKTKVRYEFSQDVYKNLILGLQSDNQGLRKSCAYYIGKYKVEEAILPLMAQLRKEKDDDTKILFATALYQIGDSRGMYLVKIIADKDNNERVRNRCAVLYNEFVKSGSTVAAL